MLDSDYSLYDMSPRTGTVFLKIYPMIFVNTERERASSSLVPRQN